ncbi:dihydrodipicolinate synthase family protein [Pedobacter nyackensis]|uniref:N-acetylneuraminate lyase n=1 Tax=Pedobacter nyackensis TaxID=475255 RepID=A0A1W2C2N9_9SPHI|nr:dihydrodipicolinate synthase family protein [Pedobacter nyackensis]SMC79361.1 N-acetylneuraminate lyase [Pedobacter nyackensis]
MDKIKGLVAAVFAAYHEDGTINTAIIPELVEKMIADGLSGVFICGTNGEGPNLTMEERMAIAEAYVREAKQRIKVLIHVGHTSIAESRKLAAHAQEIGADAISSVAAFYFKPSGVKNLVDSIAEIAAAAPELPFYYYHIPTLTGIAMDMVEFLEIAETKIPNLAGIKYTASTLHEYQSCLNYKNGKFDMLFGYDEMLLSALSVGAQGAIGSTYTFAAPLYLKVMSLYENNEHERARVMQLHAVNMVRCLVKFPPIPAQRAIMKSEGIELGTCRLPLVALDVEQEKALHSSLTAVGFFSILKDVTLLQETK